jgi:hypothetical protein
MYRDTAQTLDERDRAVGAILIGEALIASCERARQLGQAARPDAWRAIRDAHDDFPEIWRSLDRARHELARRGVNVAGYDELRPHVRSRLATAQGDDDPNEVRVDPVALDDARRATDELKLAVPGADWAAIDRRTSGLVAAPLVRVRRNRLILIGFALAFVLGAGAALSTLAPRHRAVARDTLREELAQIADQRRVQIVELQRALEDRCDPPLARALAKQLVMDGRGGDALRFAAAYAERCGADDVVTRWANAPLP